jgi:hypothetical protein
MFRYVSVHHSKMRRYASLQLSNLARYDAVEHSRMRRYAPIHHLKMSRYAPLRCLNTSSISLNISYHQTLTFLNSQQSATYNNTKLTVLFKTTRMKISMIPCCIEQHHSGIRGLRKHTSHTSDARVVIIKRLLCE